MIHLLPDVTMPLRSILGPQWHGPWGKDQGPGLEKLTKSLGWSLRGGRSDINAQHPKGSGRLRLDPDTFTSEQVHLGTSLAQESHEGDILTHDGGQGSMWIIGGKVELWFSLGR